MSRKLHHSRSPRSPCCWLAPAGGRDSRVTWNPAPPRARPFGQRSVNQRESDIVPVRVREFAGASRRDGATRTRATRAYLRCIRQESHISYPLSWQIRLFWRAACRYALVACLGPRPVQVRLGRRCSEAALPNARTGPVGPCGRPAVSTPTTQRPALHA